MRRLKTFDVLIQFFKTSLATELEYKLNAYVEVLSVIGNLFGSIFLLSIFFSSGNTLGGWTFNSSLVVLGMYTLLEALTTSLLQPNLSRIVRDVQNGTLDFVLLKPFDSQLWLSLRVFSPWGIPSFIAGFMLLSIGIIGSGVTITPFGLLIAILMIISSFFILYSIWFILATTTIWFVKVWNSTEVLRSVLVAGRYPITAYPYHLRTIFTFIIPIAFLTSVPAEALLGISSTTMVLYSLFIATIFFYTVFNTIFFN